MKEIFTWPVKIGADGETDFNTKTIQYDNGYEQNISVGRNSQREKWKVSLTDRESVIDEIKAFIKRHGGVKSFYWTPPLCEQGLYLAGNPNTVAHGGASNKKMYTISFEMRQVFSAADNTTASTPIYSVNGKTATEGVVTLSAYDIGAEEKGAAGAAIKSLKTETNPLPQYAFKKDIPDIAPLSKSIANNAADIADLQEKLASTDDNAEQLYNELESTATKLYEVADEVTANKSSIASLQENADAADKEIATNKKAINKLDSVAVKSINGHKPDDKGSLIVIDDSQTTDSTTYSGIKIDKDLKACKERADTGVDELAKQLHGNIIPLFFVAWWPLRSSIPSGFVAADGQELSCLTFPDAAKAILENQVPCISVEKWIDDPSERGCYCLDQQAGNFRVPDYNGMTEESLGAVFLRGDNGTVPNGQIQKDALGEALIPITYTANGSGLGANYWGSKSRLACGIDMTGAGWTGGTANWTIISDVNKINLGSSETRPLNVSGCFIIKLFGAVVNTGEADYAQLVTDYANLSAKYSVLESKLNQKKFTIIYPDKGTEADPAKATTNKRYIEDNPFPGEPVLCEVEILINGIWGGQVGWLDQWGISVGHIVEDDKIVIQTGASGIALLSYRIGGIWGNTTTNYTTVPFRVKVWRM